MLMEKPTKNDAEPRPAKFLAVARAVFWSFLGIRKKSHYHEDAVTIKPYQVVIAGILGAIVFILVLVMVVRIVTAP
jgi:CRISPR/Cas system CMR subunit Cmr6 (Cas7 group RAMP superfamily)